MVKPVNLMEIMVEDMLEKISQTRNDFCSCERCKADIIAYALNHLPPKYVVTDKGQAMVKASLLNCQISTDLLVEINKAIEIVTKYPRHGNSSKREE